MSRTLFGTDGIRGIANVYPMTASMALRLGLAIGRVLTSDNPNARLVIGKDTRISGYMLESAIVAGITARGCDALLVGPLSTPGVAHIITTMRADGGVVISASHNPYQDNGIKIFGRDGFKLRDELERHIEELLLDDSLESDLPTGRAVGRAVRVDDAVGRYASYLKLWFPRHLTLEGVKVALDAANGAAYKTAPIVFEELGARCFVSSAHPNGYNINDECGSLHPEAIQKRVLEEKADIGIALDGDADRVILVDESGAIVDGNAILYIAACHLKELGTLNGDTIVTTTMANMGLDAALKRKGIKTIRTQVGDRYVVERMRSGGLNVGGEPSGHVIFLDSNTTADGILTALHILAVMKERGVALSTLARDLRLYPQILLSVAVREKRPLELLNGFNSLRDSLERSLTGRGRIDVRYSGTQQVARVMCEGEDAEEVSHIAEQLANCIRAEIGA